MKNALILTVQFIGKTFGKIWTRKTPNTETWYGKQSNCLGEVKKIVEPARHLPVENFQE